MNKLKQLGVVFAVSMLFTQTANATEKAEYFPVSEDGFIGDPMPFTDGDEMHIFYLNDQRNGSVGFHPWNKASTSDFVHFNDIGEVVSVVHDPINRDLALGTGSVIKKDGTYYAFYTAHNANIEPREVIRIATSKNLYAGSWAKSKTFMLSAPVGYDINNFRDPYVFYNNADSSYCMLVTARKDDHGVIICMKSNDLLDWGEPEVLYKNETNRSNMECPTLIEYGGYWYLSYSEQEPNRIVKYLVAANPEGPFKVPEINYFDGIGFYAGRLEKLRGNLYAVGWVPSKANSSDDGAMDWGGNLVVHKLRQTSDGRLASTALEERKQLLEYEETLEGFNFNSEGFNIKSFAPLDKRTIIEAKLRFKATDNSSAFGFGFNNIGDKNGTNIVFDVGKNQIRFYDSPLKSGNHYEIKVGFDFTNKDEINFQLVCENSVAVLYVNNEIALTTRNYNGIQKKWSIFSDNCELSAESIKIMK